MENLLMKKDIQKCLEIYKEQLNQGYIQTAYLTLIQYVGQLKSKFPKDYKTGNISFGYLDYTYFAFFNQYLRDQKLRFGIVLNHEKLQFELWLMGQNADIQRKYWKILKKTKWNHNQKIMPEYSIVEIVLEINIDFENQESMTHHIIERSVSLASQIQEYLIQIHNE